jgi:hypothetical protein
MLSTSTFRLAAALGAALVGASSAAAQVKHLEPGSVLIYAGHRSGPMMWTILNVTNIATAPATPMAFGGSIALHFQYVNTKPNALDPFKPLDCQIFDRIEFLTPADTLSVLTACHNAYGPGGQEGYVVVSAQDPAQFNVDVCHDFLIGSQFSVNSSGAAFSLEAYPVQCAAGAPGMPTDLNGNGQLDFDGLEYVMLPDVLYVESFLAVIRSHLCLINLTGGPLDCNALVFSIWNDNEFPVSATLRFNCWFDQPLERISPLFGSAFFASLPNDPNELDINCDGIGDVETGWARIQSRGVFDAGGQQIAPDGVILGCITDPTNGDPWLWEVGSQCNGSFLGPMISVICQKER